MVNSEVYIYCIINGNQVRVILLPIALCRFGIWILCRVNHLRHRLVQLDNIDRLGQIDSSACISLDWDASRSLSA